jgi:hypothetical protein
MDGFAIRAIHPSYPSELSIPALNDEAFRSIPVKSLKSDF